MAEDVSPAQWHVSMCVMIFSWTTVIGMGMPQIAIFGWCSKTTSDAQIDFRTENMSWSERFHHSVNDSSKVSNAGQICACYSLSLHSLLSAPLSSGGGCHTRVLSKWFLSHWHTCKCHSTDCYQVRASRLVLVTCVAVCWGRTPTHMKWTIDIFADSVLWFVAVPFIFIDAGKFYSDHWSTTLHVQY